MPQYIEDLKRTAMSINSTHRNMTYNTISGVASREKKHFRIGKHCKDNDSITINNRSMENNYLFESQQLTQIIDTEVILIELIWWTTFCSSKYLL